KTRTPRLRITAPFECEDESAEPFEPRGALRRKRILRCRRVKSRSPIRLSQAEARRVLRPLAPRLLAVFGSCRERFESAEEVQLLTGIAPVTISSGKRSFVRWRWSAPTFVRQTLHEFAHHSIRSSRWAQAYYEQQRERGHDHHQAVRSLAFKWIRVLWRCWHDRTPYDEARYIEALIRRGSPLAARLQALAA
ncbi:MAG: transposase, partial [Gemmatimonas sp.]|nr:transposase [Gemmatimonas sp.]